MRRIPPSLLLFAGLWACSDAPEDSRPGAQHHDPPGWNRDHDGDGWTPAVGDCDDTDPNIHPLVEELPDGIDEDCDEEVDEHTVASDDDGDGYSEREGDCDDTSRRYAPGARERFLCDAFDENCSGSSEPCEPLDAALVIAGDPYASVTHSVDGGVDMSGDGRPDLLTFNGDLRVWSIPEGGGELTPLNASARVGSSEEFFPYYRLDAMAILGDTNGDGFGELVLALAAEEAYVISAPLVGETAAADIAVATYLGDVDTGFGGAVDAGQDTNGDGVAELLVSAAWEDDSAGSVYLFSGDGRGLLDTSSAFARIHGENSGEWVGLGARFSGDNDGDGLDDLLVAAGVEPGSGVRVGWFSGPLQGSVAIRDADVLVEQLGDGTLNYNLAHMGDLNGDGRADLVVQTFWDPMGRLYVFTDGLRTNADEATARLEVGSLGYFYQWDAAAVVDVNGDRLGDLVLGDRYSQLGGYWQLHEHAETFGSGAVALFLAPFVGVLEPDAAARIWSGESRTAGLGTDLAGVGDVNGDGFDDFLIASPDRGDYSTPDAFAGAAYLMLGAAIW